MGTLTKFMSQRLIITKANAKTALDQQDSPDGKGEVRTQSRSEDIAVSCIIEQVGERVGTHDDEH